MAKEDVEIDDVMLVSKRANSWLVETAHGDQVSLPFSNCSYDEASKVFTVPYWLAEKEGLI